MRRPAAPLAFVVLALAGTRPLAAQHLRLQVVEAETLRPLAGALVEVLDSAGTIAVQVVLSAAGERQVRLPAAGTYRARLRRIGYQPFVGPATVVASGATVTQRLEAPPRRVTLASVNVTAPPRCARDAFSDPAFVGLWDAVRTALTTTSLTRDGAGLEAESRSYRRRLDVRREPVAVRVGLPRITGAERPYVARSADSLSRFGYLQRGHSGQAVFFAPDEQVLLSEEFLRDHCFSLRRGADAEDGELGIRFVPARRRDVTDISGTIWVDSASAELRRVDFAYELPDFPVSVVGDGRTGGEIVFGRTAAGLWVVSAWRLRMPHFSEASRIMATSEPAWWVETGGVMTPPPVDTTRPQRALLPYHELLIPGSVTGTLHDSIAGGPLRDARVWLLPAVAPDDADLEGAGRIAVAPRFVTTDATGAFTLDTIPPGTYRLAVDHGGLDSLGVPLPSVGLRLGPGVTVHGALATPSLRTLHAGCLSPSGAVHGATAQGLLLGVVRSAGDQRPIEGALVRVAWNAPPVDRQSLADISRSVEARTDSLGTFRVCGIPLGSTVAVRAAGERSATGAVRVEVGDGGIARVALRLPDVEPGEREPAAATIVGTLADSTGSRTPDAVVSVEGTALEARTDSVGAFRLAGVPPGTQTIHVRRLGMSPIHLALDLEPGGTTRVALVAQRARLLERLTTIADREGQSPFLQEAINRHKFGGGYLRMAEWLAERPSLQSAIQTIPGVRVTEGRDRTTFGNEGLVIYMRSSKGADCQARVFLDMMEIGMDQQNTVQKDRLAAMEVYTRPAFAPLFTQGKSLHNDDDCGVVILWSKR